MRQVPSVLQAVEVRDHAQQQREQVERLKDRARQRQGIAQRMQRSSAALRRSLALSVHVAILQAHALASACTAMLVRPHPANENYSPRAYPLQGLRGAQEAVSLEDDKE